MVRTLFTLIWWIGFLVAVGLMVWLYIDIDAIANKNIFLLLGVTHMAILVVFGFWAILKVEDDNFEVASRVSTMGYLHTLIGTSVALIQMASISGNIAGNLKSILIPIGSALLTSIIGWAFAKEMERDRYRYKHSSKEEVEDSLAFLADKIRTAGINFEATSFGWEKSIELTVNKLRASTDRLDSSIQTVEDGFANSMQSSEEFLKNLHGAFTKTFTQMEVISEEWNKHLVTLEKFSKQADGSLEELFKNSKKVADEVTIVAQTLPSARNIIQEVDSLIALLRERDESGF
jgi:hypothetical protein